MTQIVFYSGERKKYTGDLKRTKLSYISDFVHKLYPINYTVTHHLENSKKKKKKTHFSLISFVFSKGQMLQILARWHGDL